MSSLLPDSHLARSNVSGVCRRKTVHPVLPAFRFASFPPHFGHDSSKEVKEKCPLRWPPRLTWVPLLSQCEGKFEQKRYEARSAELFIGNGFSFSLETNMSRPDRISQKGISKKEANLKKDFRFFFFTDNPKC